MTSRRNSTSSATSSGKGGDSDSKSHLADDATDVEKGQALSPRFIGSGMPTRSATFQLPENRRRNGYSTELTERERTLEATQSIGGLSLARATARQGLDPRARVAAEFRTLSIQLSEGGTPTDLKIKQKQKVAQKELSAIDWHLISVDEVFQRLGTSPTLGLDDTQIKRRRERDGLNKISKPPNKWFRKIMGYFLGGFGSILLVASILVFIAWKPLGQPNPQVSVLALAIVLLAVLFLQAFFNAWQDFTTSRTMASIGSMLPSQVLVIRDGQRTSIPADQLVKGDVVVVGMGQRMAADMRFFHLDGELKIDRSMLTGESDAIKSTVDKTDENYLESRNVALMGTMAVSGAGGLAVVTAVGDDTVFGRLAKTASKPKTGRTTLEKEIFIFVITIAALATAIAVICIIVWGAFLRPKHPDFMSVSAMVVNVVSVFVAFIPEGLPIAVTLSLTAIAAKMRKSRVLAKSLSVVETLGAVNVICSDKTGTLTTNRMRATSLAVFGFDATCTPQDALKHLTLGAPVGLALRSLAWLAGSCNAATFAPEEDEKTRAVTPLADRPINGDATDSACLRLSAELLGDIESVRGGWNIIGNLAFNSKNKFAVKVLQSAAGDEDKIAQALSSPTQAASFNSASEVLMVCKGAPDILLKRCNSVQDAGGEVLPLTPERLADITQTQSEWADQGQRVLVLARKVVSRSDLPEDNIDDDVIIAATTGLTVVGLVGIVDPPRPEIPGVVATCRGAGARFFMVTGDFQNTAVAIARQCGIITSRTVYGYNDLSDEKLILPQYSFLNDNASRPQLALSLSGSDIQKMEQHHWERACRFDEIVFARTTPEQKLRIVSEFQKRDGVVSMTGDGANDSPALRQADVGVAIAGGSDIAMESADLVLLDSFSGFVDAMVLGRLCFDNLKKTVAYLLVAGTFCELWAVLVAFLFGLPQALGNLQMIFICVLTDIGPSLSLINESPESDILKRKPRDVKKDRLADWKLLFHSYLFLGIPMTAFTMAMTFWFLERHGLPFSSLWLNYGGSALAQSNPDAYNELVYRAQSVYFFTLILGQWGTLLIVRTRKLSIFQQPPYGKPSTSNWYILPAMILALLIAVFLSYIPALQNVFQTRGIPAENYGLAIAYALFMIAVDEGRKFCVRRWPQGLLAKMAW
ncbi:unnamed protein product [Sympodiomycopsis kandeliae]